MLKVGLVFMLLILTGCGQKEVPDCNSEAVKATLMKGTWEKQRNALFAYWQNQFSTFKRVPYVCSPIEAYYAPYQINGPSREVILEAYNKQCSGWKAERKKDEDSRETFFNQNQKELVNNIEILKKVEVTLGNIRQQNYDEQNNVRYCAAEFEYRNVLHNWIVTQISNGGITCPNLISYKIEFLLDKPDQFLVSWNCQPG